MVLLWKLEKERIEVLDLGRFESGAGYAGIDDVSFRLPKIYSCLTPSIHRS